MSDDVGEKIAELQRQIDELKKAQEPKPEFVPRPPMPKIDWTAGMKMHPSAAQEMAKVVHDVKHKPITADEVASSWARSRISGPASLIPPGHKETKKMEQPKAVGPAKDTRSPQTRIFDAMVDAMVGGPNDTSKLR